MFGLLTRLGAVLIALASASSAAARPIAQVPTLAEDRAAIDAAVAATCRKKIVLLGEAAHGNGHSDAFKAGLVERLVELCGFKAVLFEASFYEFVPIWRAQRAKQRVTPGNIATAVGGLWKFDREFQPLLPYLAAKTNQGLFVGGIDFQLGGIEQDYANKGMIEELTGALESELAETCRTLVAARIMRDLSGEQRALATTCTDAIARELMGKRGGGTREQAAMLQNLIAYLGSAMVDGPGPYIGARDKQMFTNLEFILARLPRQTKTIIWTANAHAAKGADEANGFAGVRNLGDYVFARYGNRSYALATTAVAGTQRWGRQAKPLPEAPLSSLERLAFGGGGSSSVFLDGPALKAIGTVPGGAFGYQYVEAAWWRRFDGVVVFAEEHAAFSSRYGN